ncbi:hypothetical protein H072_6757 [Dactylellina haptotyla CBS 200.50]|uniref:Uncharacterized protein n=1 Tax=Dactylellina haptotyla (strain CBS 200.50) TaxID=1284197 RepID=S8A998_DACHA|nr:hypothetical protein H072_6757 [Dactylellina haptotyla CBS 200.50]
MSDYQPLLQGESSNQQRATPSGNSNLAARIVERVQQRLRRYRLIRQQRAAGLSINVNLAASRPESLSPDRNIQRPWTREIRRLLRRLHENDYEQFMVHRAYGYHGMPCPNDTEERFRRAHEIGRLERRWEDSASLIPSANTEDARVIGLGIDGIAELFDTSENINAPSSDATSSYKAWY